MQDWQGSFGLGQCQRECREIDHWRCWESGCRKSIVVVVASFIAIELQDLHIFDLGKSKIFLLNPLAYAILCGLLVCSSPKLGRLFAPAHDLQEVHHRNDH